MNIQISGENELKTVSIILPIYNGEKYLDKSISSILNQTYENIELLLIDDCSTDDSVELCKKYREKDKRIKLFQSPKNSGTMYLNFYLFKDNLRDYIMCTDQDDWLEKDMVELMVKGLEESKSDVIVCDYYINENTPSYPGTKDMLLDNSEAIAELMLDRNIKAYYWNKLYKKEVFTKGIEAHIRDTEVFDDFVTMPYILKNANTVKCISNRLYHYFMNPDSFSLSTKRSMLNYYLSRSYWHRLEFLNHYYPSLDSKRVISKAFSNSLGAWRMLIKDKRNVEANKLYRLMKANHSRLKEADIPIVKKFLIGVITK